MKWEEQAKTMESHRASENRKVELEPPEYYTHTPEWDKQVRADLPQNDSPPVLDLEDDKSAGERDSTLDTGNNLTESYLNVAIDAPANQELAPSKKEVEKESLPQISLKSAQTLPQGKNESHVVDATPELDWLLNPNDNATFLLHSNMEKLDASGDFSRESENEVISEALPRAMGHLLENYSNLVSRTALQLILRDSLDDLTQNDLRWHLNLLNSSFLFSSSSFCSALSDELFWKGLDFGNLRVCKEEVPYFVVQRLERAGFEREVEEWSENPSFLSFTEKSDGMWSSDNLRSEFDVL
jgi:hypothetical protein